MAVSREHHITVVNGYRNWRQCGMAEPRMLDALKDGAIVFLQGVNIVFKLNGKPSGICYEDQTLPNGTQLQRAHWYAPTGTSESIFTEALKRGETTFSLTDKTDSLELADMREVEVKFQHQSYTAEEVLEKTRRYALERPQQIPETFGERRITREEYLVENGQSNWDQG